MSGENVSYHLRYNKFIERRLFSNLLLRIHRYRDISDYTYIGFGGVFLEDFKSLHSDFGIKSMVSIENTLYVYQRQAYNKPLSCIEYLNTDSGQFIADYSSQIASNAIVWLDYASPGEIKSQLLESQSLLSKMRPYDILKVTFNCNEATLYDPPCDGTVELAAIKQEKRWKKLKDRLQNLFNVVENSFSMRDINREVYPLIILKLLQNVSALALRSNSNLEFLPLSNIVYADSGHRMLTVTGVVVPKADKSNFLATISLENWADFVGGWEKYSKIDVPILTSKEKLEIDGNLPKEIDAAVLAGLLPFPLAADEEKTAFLLENYIRLYRYYPNFLRVVL